MKKKGRMAGGRIAALTLVVALPLSAALACGVGDPVVYTQQGISGEGGGVGPDIGPVGDSTFDVLARPDDGGSFPEAPHPPNCGIAAGGLDLDGGPCDPTAGLGCCLLAGNSDPTKNSCNNQVEYFTPPATRTFCNKTNDVFLSCVGSNSDNTCCWQETNGRSHTRFRAGCYDGGFEACDPTADGGMALCNGTLQHCEMVMCSGVPVGKCPNGGDIKCTP